MTTQVMSPEYARSKALLQHQLNFRPEMVLFKNVTPLGDHEFSGRNMMRGESFPVVMDPQTRMRFAQVSRLPNGTFKVK